MYKPTVNNINGPVENASSGVLQLAYWSCILYQIPSGITILFTTPDRPPPPSFPASAPAIPVNISASFSDGVPVMQNTEQHHAPPWLGPAAQPPRTLSEGAVPPAAKSCRGRRPAGLAITPSLHHLTEGKQ
ncbi:hypothetical protein E2C01_053182 [Portunus trituberculatus]|uniref:Uncharacterized protein n=1 Tax=Portunus trituberculatus TaxID=210409 RepID=A0A5B7GQ44_PORTR|nr:hypothetical protein [Portunus trituberculatus]